MKLYNSITWDIETGRMLAADWQEYTGPVAECKRKKSKKLAEEQLRMFTDLLQQELKLRGQFTGPLLAALTPFLSGERGFSPKALASLRGQAIEGTSARFQDLGGRLRTQLARRGAAGGQVPPSGDFARNLLGLGALEESERAGALRDVTVRDELLRLQNLFGAANVLGGVGSQFRADPFIGGSSNALNIQAQLATAPSFGQQLGLAAIGAGGQAAGGLLGNPNFFS